MWCQHNERCKLDIPSPSRTTSYGTMLSKTTGYGTAHNMSRPIYIYVQSRLVYHVGLKGHRLGIVKGITEQLLFFLFPCLIRLKMIKELLRKEFMPVCSCVATYPVYGLMNIVVIEPFIFDFPPPLHKKVHLLLFHLICTDYKQNQEFWIEVQEMWEFLKG